jgi:hypothetical protein
MVEQPVAVCFDWEIQKLGLAKMDVLPHARTLGNQDNILSLGSFR